MQLSSRHGSPCESIKLTEWSSFWEGFRSYRSLEAAHEIGVFIPIGSNGWIVSTTSPRYKPSFERNKQTTLNAERYGFDFACR